ncbi:MAG: cation:proton antiporter [Acidiferrobacterales bacterium]
MDVHTFLLALFAILLSARILGELAAQFGTPPVIGELLAGVLLGPSLLGWINPSHEIRLLAEIGVILLLFEVGLETDIMRLVRTGLRPVVVATAGFVLPFIFGYILSRHFYGLNRLASLFVGGTLTATSIGITVRLLTDLRRRQSDEAQVVLGAAVLDDVMGVVLLAFLYQFSRRGQVDLAGSGKVLLFVVLFMILAPLAARIMAGVIKRLEAVSRIPGLIPTTVVSLVLFFAWLAREVGAPELLGGFAAGLALSRRFFFPLGTAVRSDPDFVDSMKHEMRPIIHLFTPIFFVMAGLSLNLRTVDWSSPFIWTFSLSLFALAVAGKVAAAFFIRGRILPRVAIGLAMVPRGEVGLVFAELGYTSGLISSQVHAALIFVIALTTFLPAFGMRWFYAHYAERLSE